ncbi:MAG: hypothetical protein GY855_15525 [candidate division Zixibacteria bacterium]|nr:hypothetical protein [candidate division Zixibacteria bacterium]
MRKLNLLFCLVFALCLATNSTAGRIPSYYNQYDFLMTSPAVYQEGLLGFANPASLGFLHNSEMRFYWSTDGTDAGSFNNWGLFWGFPNAGFGALRKKYGDIETTDYRLSVGGGSRDFSFGMGYGWSSSNMDAFKNDKVFKSSIIMRPCQHTSIGLSGDFSFESRENQGIAELGIRPLGTSRLTLFGDFAMQRKTVFKDAPWSAGAAVEVVPGINLTGRYFENEAFTVGLNIDFGEHGLASQVHFDNEQEHAYNTYQVRLGGMRSSVFPTIFDKDKKFLKMNLKGRVAYLDYKYFDEGKNRFLDILEDIRAAVDDPRVSAIALNLSSIKVVPEHAWEIREELREARNKGKTVIAFIDDAGMTSYHLASIADKIVLDPMGMIMLEGFALSRTYLKGTLDKMGLGIDEWRYFKYKSAAETFSRQDMSDADREQFQDYVDDKYETIRADVCESRSFTTVKFDSLVDESMVFLPKGALENGLVDTLARWSDVGDIVKKLTGKKLGAISKKELFANSLQEDEWGPLPEIAVVYGLGVCAMDTGIKGRWLEKVFLGLKNNKKVKAVVFRVDSPGGGALSSDLVAEALKKCAKEKPVIISQGQVAGSGGYWISMYGDKIVAGPSTVTGSIGIIGLWIYNNGFGDKIGLTSDHVQRGKHADLMTGIRMPFLNFTVPERNLTQEEKGFVKDLFMEAYGDFVKKVAEGRNLTEEKVREIGEGHFYSGIDGKAIGLVDEIGGLQTAIAIAKKQAGIKPDEKVTLREIPKYKGTFNFPSFSPMSIKNVIEEDYDLRMIRMILDHNGKPLPMLMPGTYPVLID